MDQKCALNLIDHAQPLPALTAYVQLNRQHLDNLDLNARYVQDVGPATIGVSDYLS
jgi:hypothetical protein